MRYGILLFSTSTYLRSDHCGSDEQVFLSICTIEVLPPWVVPIFCLALGLLVLVGFRQPVIIRQVSRSVSLHGWSAPTPGKDTLQLSSTVVLALGDPRRERPPALYGHVINAPTDTIQR